MLPLSCSVSRIHACSVSYLYCTWRVVAALCHVIVSSRYLEYFIKFIYYASLTRLDNMLLNKSWRGFHALSTSFRAIHCPGGQRILLSFRLGLSYITCPDFVHLF